MSEKLCFKVHGEWLTNFIRHLYYGDDLSYEECKKKLLLSLCMNDISENKKEELAQAIIFGDKRLEGVNELSLVDDEDFDIYDYSRFKRPKFNKNEHVIGILTREGLFVQCRYREHSCTIEEIGEEKAKGSLAFWRDSAWQEFHVTKDSIESCTTKYQRAWIEKNKAYLTEDQLKDIRRMYKIEDHKKENKGV